MDLRLFARVVWRFRFLVGCGLLLALALALLSTVRLQLEAGGPSFTYRSPEVWETHSTLLVTQQGFPWGRTVYDEVIPIAPESGSQLDLDTPGEGFVPRFADPGRFQQLALLYSHLVESDQVRALVARTGAIRGFYEGTPVPSADGNSILPVVRIRAVSSSPAEAISLARRATDSFRRFLDQQQAESRIPAEKRVQVPVIGAPEKAKLLEGRSITKPVFLFLLVMVLTIGLAFLLENLRPRIRPVQTDDIAPAAREARRRSA